MLTTLYNAFIPHPGNNHKPHALRPRMLTWYALVLIAIKVIAAFAMFVVYPDPALVATDIKQEITTLINASRAENNLPPLTPHVELERAAQLKAVDMITHGYFDHTTPDGKLPWTFIDKTTYTYRTAGENLAVDFVSAKVAHTALMQSSPHRSNILNSGFSHVGIGVVTGTFQGRETTLLVEFFGAPIPLKTKPAIIKTAKAAEQAPIPQDASLQPLIPPKPQQTAINRVEKQLPPESKEIPGESEPINTTPEKTANIPLVSTQQELQESIAAETPEHNTLSSNETVTPTPVSTASLAERVTPALAPSIKMRSTELDILSTLSTWTKRFFVATLVYLALALFVSIIVRIRVQHLDVIGQTLALIMVVATLASTHWHTIERLTNAVKII